MHIYMASSEMLFEANILKISGISAELQQINATGFDN